MALIRADTPSFRLARPLFVGGSRLELTAVAVLALAALALWVLVVPFELVEMAR